MLISLQIYGLEPTVVEVFLAPGRAVNEQTLELPPEIYPCLRQLAEAYRQAKAKGKPPIVIVSGYQRSKFVYKGSPLRDSNGNEVVEADLLAPILERQGVPCFKERRSASVGDNLAYSKQLLLDLPRSVHPTRLHIFTISSLAYRLWVLGKLVFGPGCDVQIHSVNVGTQNPEETRKLELKLFGDQLCMLLSPKMSRQMAIGNHAHIIGDGRGMSRWPVLGSEHDKVCGYAQKDSHPDHVMRPLLKSIGIPSR